MKRLLYVTRTARNAPEIHRVDKLTKAQNNVAYMHKSKSHAPELTGSLPRIHRLSHAYCMALTHISGDSEAASYSLIFFFVQYWLNSPASGWQFGPDVT